MSFFFQKKGDKNTPVELISYWHPNLTINLLDDQTPWTKGSVPSPLDEGKVVSRDLTGITEAPVQNL